MAEGQRAISKIHVNFLEGKFRTNIFTDMSQFGVWVNISKKELYDLAEAKFSSTSNVHERVEKLLNSDHVDTFLYGGQHGAMAMQRHMPKVDLSDQVSVKYKSTLVYAKPNKAEKQHLCLQHNEIQGLHMQMTDLERCVADIQYLCLQHNDFQRKHDEMTDS